MMATSFGKLEEFDPTSGEYWIQCVERIISKLVKFTAKIKLRVYENLTLSYQ